MNKSADDDISGAEISDSVSSIPAMQEEIIESAQVVEKFINDYPEFEKKDNSFNLLKILFDLFRSELSANLTLRQSILNYKTNLKTCKELDKQVTTLFNTVKDYNPTINTIEKVMDFFVNNTENIYGVSGKISHLKQELEELTDENEELKLICEELKIKVDEEERIAKTSVVEHRSASRNATNKAKELQKLYDTLKKEESELNTKFELMVGDNSNERMAECVARLDENIEDINNKIRALGIRHAETSDKLQSHIDKLEFDIEELLETRRVIEEQLDEAHSQLDQLTNPLVPTGDAGHNCFAAREEVYDLRTSLENKKNEVTRLTFNNAKLKRNVARLKNNLSTSKNMLQNDSLNKSKLNTQLIETKTFYDHMINTNNTLKARLSDLKELEGLKRNLMNEKKMLLAKLDEVRNHNKELTADNHSLRQSVRILKDELITLGKNQPYPTDEEKALFEDAIDGFRLIREHLGLPPSITPDQIVNHVLGML